VDVPDIEINSKLKLLISCEHKPAFERRSTTPNADLLERPGLSLTFNAALVKDTRKRENDSTRPHQILKLWSTNQLEFKLKD
jgi:hypothetical protein